MDCLIKHFLYIVRFYSQYLLPYFYNVLWRGGGGNFGWHFISSFSYNAKYWVWNANTIQIIYISATSGHMTPVEQSISTDVFVGWKSMFKPHGRYRHILLRNIHTFVCVCVCVYIYICSTVLTNIWFAKVNRVQHKVTMLTVWYVENCAYFLLVSKAICVNVQNLSCTQIISLQTKLIRCANSVAKSVAVWLAWRVTYEHIRFKGGRGGGKGSSHTRNWEDSHHIYIYIYICNITLKMV